VSSHAPLLIVEKLNAGYGRSQVLFDVDFAAEDQGIIAILGRNGAGKTTLLRTMMGEIRPMSGRIRFAGEELQNQATEMRVRCGLGYVPQDAAVFRSLTVHENLKLGTILQHDKSGIDEVLSFFPKLGQRLQQMAGTLSGGERKMLAIGRALLGRPRVLLLDEPTEGVWVGVIEEIADRLTRLAGKLSIVLVEQNLALALRISDRANILDRGRFVFKGSTAELLKTNSNLLHKLAP
jgi:branched-chain amino acid transport system ATP-binding protein